MQHRLLIGLTESLVSTDVLFCFLRNHGNKSLFMQEWKSSRYLGPPVQNRGKMMVINLIPFHTFWNTPLYIHLALMTQYPLLRMKNQGCYSKSTLLWRLSCLLPASSLQKANWQRDFLWVSKLGIFTRCIPSIPINQVKKLRLQTSF